MPVAEISVPVTRRHGSTAAGARAGGGALPTLLAVGFFTATFASRIGPLAGLVTAATLALAFARFALTGRLDRIGWATLAYLGYVLVLAAAVGSLPHLHQLAGFASFDGRAFVAYAPLIAYSTVRTGPRDLARLRTVMRVGVIGGLGLLALALVHAVPGLTQKGNFVGLTSSHHVPGLLFGVIAIALAAAPDPRAPGRDRIFALGALAIVLASGSRTALVGVLAAALYTVVTAPDLARRLRNVMLIALVGALALILSGRLLGTVQYLASSDFVSAASAEFAQPDSAETGKRLDASVTDQPEVANVLIRFGVWRAGLDEFARSPVVGIGSFRLNDPEREYLGVPGVMDLAIRGEDVQSGGFGAHNLVIQTLAETGIVGLVLLSRPWRLLRRRFRVKPLLAPEARAGLTLIVYALGTMLTSNSLISPALIFPLGTCVMTWARYGTAEPT